MSKDGEGVSGTFVFIIVGCALFCAVGMMMWIDSTNKGVNATTHTNPAYAFSCVHSINTELGVRIHRCENQEAACYVTNTGGISCKFK
jgi:hypothetical protein